MIDPLPILTTEISAPPIDSAGDTDVAAPAHSGIPSNAQLRRGDLARIRIDDVNFRTWMAKSAPVRRTLRDGQQCLVLSDRYVVDNRSWYKVRPLDSNLTGYVAGSYLELIESGFDPALPADDSIEVPDAIGAGYQTGDFLASNANLNVRSGPGVEHESLARSGGNKLGIVLGEPIVVDSQIWVPVQFATGSGWIAAINTRFLARRGKWIEADLSQQRLIARRDASIVNSSPISSGKSGHPTPHGIFGISTKIPTRRLRGKVRGESWDIPDVPWIMIFREGGFYIHAAFWHDDFGTPVSHGCVTVPVDFAEWLYEWTPLHTPLWIHS